MENDDVGKNPFRISDMANTLIVKIMICFWLWVEKGIGKWKQLRF